MFNVRVIMSVMLGMFVPTWDLVTIPAGIRLILLLVPTFYLLFGNYERKEEFQCGVFISWFFPFILLIFISSIWTNNESDTGFVFKRVISGFVLTVTALQLLKDRTYFIQILRGIVIGGIIGCIITYLFESASIELSLYGERFGGETYGSGPEFASMALYAYYSCILLILLGEKKRILYICLIVMFIICIFLSGARQALANAVIYLLAITLMKRRVSFGRILIVSVAIIVFVYTISIIIMNVEIFYNTIGYRLSNVLDLYGGIDNSKMERDIMRSFALSVFQENPILGVGVHGFAKKFGEYYGWEVWSHSGFTEIMSCYGLLGMLLFYRIYWTYFKRARIMIEKNRIIGSFLLIHALLSFTGDYFWVAFLDVRCILFLGIGLQYARQETFLEEDIR